MPKISRFSDVNFIPFPINQIILPFVRSILRHPSITLFIKPQGKKKILDWIFQDLIYTSPGYLGNKRRGGRGRENPIRHVKSSKKLRNVNGGILFKSWEKKLRDWIKTSVGLFFLYILPRPLDQRHDACGFFLPSIFLHHPGQTRVNLTRKTSHPISYCKHNNRTTLQFSHS